MSSIGWYVQRLRAMDGSEVAWRASRLAAATARRFARTSEPTDAELFGGREPDWAALLAAFRAGDGRPVLLDRGRATELAAAHPAEVEDLVAAAQRVAARRFTYFGYPEAQLDDPIAWHRDPHSGVRWPACPSERIDHRTERGDPKWIWELNRLQHLPVLAQAWLVTGDATYADAALAQLDSWVEQNPPGIGIAWRGAFEAGVRAMSVAVAMQGLRDAPGLDVHRFRRYVRMLAESARRCWHERSRFSSANNHLVGELGGLFTVAALVPELAASARWERQALQALRAEAEKQILPDGAGAEQSVTYQIYTADVFCIVIALLTRRGDHAPTPIVHAVERSADYLAGLVGDRDPQPRYGDDDGSFALRLSAAPQRELRAHLGTAAAVTGNRRAVRAGHRDLTAGWLATDRSAKPPEDVGPAGSIFAPHGGLVVLRAPGRRTTIDVGPLGYLAIAAHGHADALAVTLSVDGAELVGDPGTGSYYPHPEWRDAHRGTLLHATVCLDGRDQSVAAGSFLWSRHASVKVHRVDLDRGIVDAEHDGYRRLDPPVVHRRWLIAPEEEETLVVVDLLDGVGAHQAVTSWPLHPQLEVRPTATGGHLALRGGVPALHLEHGASVPCAPYAVRGAAPSGPGGWWSDHLEARVPSWRVGSSCRTDGPTVLATVLAPLPRSAPAPADVRVVPDGRRIEVTWTEGERRRRVCLDRSRAGAVQSDAEATTSREGR